jgi:hypothetical protein
VIILVVAALTSFVLGEWLDGGAIMAIVLLNAIIGVVQENNAEQALATAIGPLIEVPVLISLVYVALWIRRTFFAAQPSPSASSSRSASHRS